jgi:hypothetical protein
MAQFIPCVYCLKVPPLDKARRGNLKKCPLCRTEILVTRSEASYRMRTQDGEEIHVPPSRLNWPWVLFAIGGSALLAVAASLLLQIRSREVPSVIASVPQGQRLFAEPPMSETLPYPAEWTPPVATTKVGDNQLVLAAKNAPKIVVGETKPFRRVPPIPPIMVAKSDEPKPIPLTARLFSYSQDMRIWLSKVPEVFLEETPKYGKTLKDAEKNISKLVKDIAEQNKKTTDGFIHELKAKRADLAGLPFQLSPGCQLEKPHAQFLQSSSRTLRALLDQSRRKSYNAIDGSFRFWSTLRGQSLTQQLPALVQILQPEETDYRHGLIRTLAAIDGEYASSHLARLALFDPDLEIRQSAIETLRNRPKAEYAKEMLDGLRYPWALVVQRAADTIVVLKCDNLVPQIIGLLRNPDPTAPYMKDVNWQKSTVVREVVKINHHRNCLLCHAPSHSREELVRAPVPNPYRELPPPSMIYQERPGTTGNTFVRADVTYLRQDFSVSLVVDGADPWPKIQRFDFLVRERPATTEDQTPIGSTEYHQTILGTLRELTGMEDESWAALCELTLPGAVERIWKSTCVK